MENALQQSNFEDVLNHMTNMNVIDIPIATKIIEHILKNFNRTNWQYKNDSINRMMFQINKNLDYASFDKSFTDCLFKLLSLFHDLKIRNNWATSIFQQLNKPEISEAILLDMIDMQHHGVFKLLVEFNEDNKLLYLKRSCRKNGNFDGDFIIFILQQVDDISIEVGEIILSMIRYDIYEKVAIIKELITLIMSKNISYSPESLNYLLEIITDIKHVTWRDELIMNLYHHKKLDKKIEYQTFKNCLDNRWFLLFSLCSPGDVTIPVYCQNRLELEKKINTKKHDIVKNYHIFCYLTIMCNLVKEPYDIKIIWYLIHLNFNQL